MVDKVLNTIEKYNMLDNRDHVILGLSGGADSVALFCLFLEIRQRYDLKVTAVHVNHGLRGTESDEDERFCVSLCEKNRVGLEVYKYDIKQVARDMEITEEEAGRKMRYQAFYTTREKLNAQKIAVAHNKNDQAETVLLRLFRGTGLKGLSGIAPVRDCIIRPLLDIGREEIEAYCRQNNLSFRNDSTNLVDFYSRNLVRNRIIPLVAEGLNPSVVKTLAQTAEIVRLEDEYLERLACDAYEKCVSDNGGSLDIRILSGFDDIIKRRVLRFAFLRINNSLVDLEFNHIDKILSLLNMQSGKKVVITKGIVVKREFGKLILNYNEQAELKFSYELKPDSEIYIKEAGLWATVSETELKNRINCNNIYTKRFYYDKIEYGLSLRTRLPNDKIRVLNVGTKKIKDYLIDKKIPPSVRNKLFYLADGENILWIIGNEALNAPEIAGNGDGSVSSHSFYVQLWEET